MLLTKKLHSAKSKRIRAIKIYIDILVIGQTFTISLESIPQVLKLDHKKGLENMIICLSTTASVMLLLQNLPCLPVMSLPGFASFVANTRNHAFGWNPDQRVVNCILPMLPSTKRSGRVYNRNVGLVNCDSPIYFPPSSFFPSQQEESI